MLERGKCLEKINLSILILIIIFFKQLSAEEISTKLKNYNTNLANSSALFIQSDGKSLEEGVIYFGYDRIKIDYSKPTPLSITLSNKKGMYVNHDLKEVEFFNTKNSYINIFFKIFNSNNFSDNTKIKISNDIIQINESLIVDNIFY